MLTVLATRDALMGNEIRQGLLQVSPLPDAATLGRPGTLGGIREYDTYEAAEAETAFCEKAQGSENHTEGGPAAETDGRRSDQPS